MINLKKNESGFGAIEAILVVVIVAAIAGVGWYVWKAKKNTLATYNGTASVSATTKPAAQTSNPYSGWKSYTLQFEKISFKYPSDWTITDTSSTSNSSPDVSPGQDNVTVKSNDPMEIVIQTGDTGVDYGCPSNKVLSSTPIKLLGSTQYLNFLGGCDEDSPANNNVSGGSIYTSATALYPFPSSKNISISKTAVAGTETPVNSFTITYSTTSASYPVSHFQQDKNYATAVKILESMTY